MFKRILNKICKSQRVPKIPNNLFGGKDLSLATNDRRKALGFLERKKRSLVKRGSSIDREIKLFEKKKAREKIHIEMHERLIEERIEFVRHGGTHVDIPFLKNAHQKLQQRISWYRDWHNDPKAPKVHIATGGVVVFGAVLSMLVMIQLLPNNSMAEKSVTDKTKVITTISAPSQGPKQATNGESARVTLSEDSVAVDFSNKETNAASATIRTTGKDGAPKSVEFSLLQPSSTENVEVEVSKNNLIEKTHAETTDEAKNPEESIQATAESVVKDKDDSNQVNMTVNPSLDIKYEFKHEQNNTQIKETLIIKDKGSLTLSPDYHVDFKMNLQGLKVSPTADGGYVLVNESGSDTVMSIMPPVIEDAEKKSGPVSLKIEGDTATYTIDKAYADNAVYPLYLDPTVTIATSTTTNPNSFSKDRTLFEATNGDMINIYSAGTELDYKISSDHGNTWGAATKIIDSSTTDDTGFSGWITADNKIHLVYSNNNTNSYIFYRQLTFATASHTITSIGTEYTVESAGTSQAFPSVTVKPDGVVYVAYRYYDGADYTVKVKASTAVDGSTWAASTTLSAATNANAATYPAITMWNANPAVIYNFANASVRWNYFTGSAWQAAGWTNEVISAEVGAALNQEFSISQATSDFYLHLAWKDDSAGIRYKKLTSSSDPTAWDVASTQITSGASHANDRNPSIGLGTSDAIYIYYSDYVGAGSYNIKYIKKLGSAGAFGAAVFVTTDNANNLVAQTALKTTSIYTAAPASSYAVTLGGTKHMTVANPPTYGTSFSVSTWFKTSASGWNWLVARTTGDYFGISSSGKLNWTRVAGADYTSTKTVTDNVWHNGIVTYNNGALKLYVDGVNYGSWTGVAQAAPSGAMCIGQRCDNVEYFPGSIDEVQIYNTELSLANTVTLYNAGIVSQGHLVGAVAGWHFEENVGTTAADFTGNNRTATLVNSPTWTAQASGGIGGAGLTYLIASQSKNTYSPVVFVSGAGSPYNLNYAPTVKVWSAAADGNWETAGNWTPSGAPAAGDNIIFDATSIKNCTVTTFTSGNGIADGIGGIYVNSGYSGTINFQKRPSQNADPFKINIAGDFIVGAGTITTEGDATVQHGGVTDGRGNEFVAQNMTIGIGASFNANGKGPALRTGPGYSNDIGSYGGEAYGATGKTYGDYSNPLSLGSSGYDTLAGGAIMLSIANELNISGTIAADAIMGGFWGGGSGGSVNINATTISGSSGSVTAKGGGNPPSGYYNTGGGGRIKLGATAIGFSGTLNAQGGRSSAGSGAAGTIYKKTAAQTYGDLIIDNGVAGNSGIYSAHLKNSIDSGSYVFDSITFRDYGKLMVVAGQSLALDSGVISGDKNSGVVNAGTVTVSDTWTLGYYFADKSGTVTNLATKDLVISATGLLTHFKNPDGASEVYKLNWSLNSLDLQANGEINVTGLGFTSGDGPGYDATTTTGSYGGEAGGAPATKVYGDYSNPVNIGSGAYDGTGGGAAIIAATGDITVAGTISANGITAFYHAGSGGSVNLTAGGVLSGNGTISANSAGGFDAERGGGGRIKISGNTIPSTPTMLAAGGTGGTVGGCGTIFKKTAAQSYGDLIIDNGTNAPALSNQAAAHLKVSSDTGSYQFDSITFRNYGRLAVDAGQTFSLASGTILGDKNSGVINAGTVTAPSSWTINHLFSDKNGTVTGLSVKDIVISSTGLLTHYPNAGAETYKLNWSFASLDLQATGEINTVGTGFANRLGTGGSANDNIGASHGGEGYGAAGTTAYGDYSNPTTIGSGGYYGAGGGAIILNATDQLTVSGTITADGQSAGNSSGGSGGSINLTAATISGTTGTITAKGASTAMYAGVAGGGRIKLGATNIGFSGTLTASGGKYSTSYYASAGTILKKTTAQSYGDLIISNGTSTPNNGDQLAAHLKTTSDTGSYQFDSVTFSNYGRLMLDPGQTLALDSGSFTGTKTAGLINSGTVTVPSDWTINHLFSDKNGAITNLADKNVTISATGRLTHYPHPVGSATETYKINWTVSSMTLQATGEISANEVGLATRQGPGKSSVDSVGASYGGEGYGAAGTTVYGDYLNPINLGSGGNTGSGGGAVILNVTNELNISGTISADALNGGYSTGGSGGSVNLTAATISGTTGSVTAKGGSTSLYDGNGSGGRIKLGATTLSYNGTYNASGGKYGTKQGAAGTVYLKTTAQANGDLIIDNGINSSAANYTPLTGPLALNTLTLQNYGKLRINANTDQAQNNNQIAGNLTTAVNTELKLNGNTAGAAAGNWSKLTVGGNATVAGKISADAAGFIHGAGVSNGMGLVSGSAASGGGYGGAGGVGAGGIPAGGQVYGTNKDNNYLGSGGGNTNGGTAGGMVQMTVAGNVDLGTTGSITANGNAGGANGGGGSGGSIQAAIAGTLTGSAATAISANGGAGGASGGGGGGGRIALYVGTDSGYAGSKNVSGGNAGTGTGTTAGALGTVFVQHSPVSSTITSPSNGAISVVQMPALHFNATDADGDWLQYKVQLATDNAFTQNVSTFDQTASQTPTDGGRSATFSNQDKTTGGGAGTDGYTSTRDAILTLTTNLTQGTTYYLRVYAYDPEGVDSFDGTQHWSAPSAVQSFTITPIERIAFSTASQNITVTFCSAITTINLRNTLGTDAVLTAGDGDKTVHLSSTSPNGKFYSDGECSNEISGANVTIAVGGSTASFYYKDTSASPVGSTWSLIASESPSAGWIDGSQPITVKPGEFGTVQLSGQPTEIVAGVPFTNGSNDITVSILDKFGNIKSDWTGDIWFYSSDSAATFPYNDVSKYTFTVGAEGGKDNGSHTFAGSNFTYKTKGNQSLVVHISEGSEFDAIGNVLVKAAAADHFGLTNYPTAAGGKFAMSAFSWDTTGYSSAPYNPAVTVYDSYNNVKDDFTGQVWFELYNAADVFGNPAASTADYMFDNDSTNHYTFVGGDAGLHQFTGSGFTVNTAANNLKLYVRTSDNGGKSTAFTISVKPQTIDHFDLLASPTISRNSNDWEASIDTALTSSMTVVARDRFGNVKTDYAYDPAVKSGMIYFYSSDALATVPYSKANTADTSQCRQFPESAAGSLALDPSDFPSNYFKFQTGGPQTITVSECIDPTSDYYTSPTSDKNKYDPHLEAVNPLKNAAATGTLPAAASTPNKIAVSLHVPGSTHTTTDSTNNANNQISASPGHQKVSLSWHNPYDIPANSALVPQVYVYRCDPGSDCTNTNNFNKVSTSPAVVAVAPNTWSNYNDTGLVNGETYSYKLAYAYKKDDVNYSVSDKSITVTASPADIAPREVTAVQLDNSDTNNAGKVKVEYKLRWNSTVSLSYFNPTTNEWSAASASAMSGDVGENITGSAELTSHTAYLDPKIDFNGQYLTESFKVRVNATVSGNPAYSDLETAIDLDSKNPVNTNFILNASADNANLTLAASDESTPIEMMISNTANFNGASWQSFATSVTNWNMGESNTVYVKIRDNYNNVVLLSRQLLGVPSNTAIKDASNSQTSEFRLAIIWTDPAIANFKQYNIWRAVNGGSYSLLGTANQNGYLDMNLNSNDLYSYKVAVEDTGGNISKATTPVSSKPGAAPDVTLPPQVELFGWKQDVGVRARITWNTDQESDSFVAYSTEPISEGAALTSTSGATDKVKVVGSPDMKLDHEIILYNLDPSVKYYYKVLSKNQIQITGFSQVFDFTTPDRILLNISGLKITDITNTGALVAWTTSKLSLSTVEYGTSAEYGQVINDETQNIDHKFPIRDLAAGTYHLRVKAIDSDGNVTLSDDYTFEIPQTPVISGVVVSDINDNGAKVSWTTNVPTNSNVDITAEGQSGSQGDGTMTTAHAVTLVGLTAKTTYSIRVRSIDTYGNTATSDSYSFTTTADEVAPKILEPKSEISSTGSGDNIRYQLIVSWQTDEPATSKIEYGNGVGSSYESSSKEDLSLNMTHTVIVTDLKPNSVYHFRIKTGDKSNNIAYSEDYTVTTPPKEKDILSIILNAIVGPLNDIYQGALSKLFKR